MSSSSSKPSSAVAHSTTCDQKNSATCVRPMAYGVDPTRPEYYSLRQARYHGVGEAVGERIAQCQAEGRKLKLLDIGIWDGVSRRHIESQPGSEIVEFHGVDLAINPIVYKRDSWAGLYEANLCDGLPFLEDDQFDVVICEQVLEHINDIQTPMATLARVLKPGGLLIVGVPIFPEGVHLVRKHAVPAIDKLVGKKKPRGHVQAFSKRTFISTLKRNANVSVLTARGFRVFSGGLLRPLENHRWWWKWNRFLGRTVPSLCTEIQVLATKERKAA